MIEHLSNAATIAVRHAGAYADLIQSDLDVSSRVVRRRVIVASIMGSALLLAVGLACVGVIAAAWDTPQRMWTIGGLLGLFVLIAAVAFWKYRALDADAPPLLSQTAGEWSKDRRLLEELLARVPPEAS